MMPTPLIYRDGTLDPFDLVPPEDRTTTIDVFFATDRAPSGFRTPASAYGSARGLALRLGRAGVRLGPESLTWDSLVARTRSNARPTMTVARVEEFGTLWTTIPETDPEFPAARASASPDDPIREPARRFASEINRRLERSRSRDIVIHVPGFNTPFATPAYRMAWLEHWLSRDAVCISYSWPAWGTAFGYSQQLSNARTSVPNLRRLIEFLAAETSAEQIHLIGLSNGTQMLLDTLLQLRLAHASSPREELRRRLRIGHVIFAAADEDLDYFRGAYLDRFDDLAESVLVYTSRHDLGLALSRIFLTGSPRVGQARAYTEGLGSPDNGHETPTVLVDVTPAQVRAGDDIYSHSYWYMNPWVSSDVILLLRRDLPPDRRALVPSPKGPGWTFPPDYPERATAIAREALSSP